jgi:hypothetical protein
MSRPSDIPESVWLEAGMLFDRLYDAEPDLEGGCEQGVTDTIARAIMAERERAVKAIDRANTDVPNIEVAAMKGDNLAVTLCSQFDDGGPDVDDYGWSQAAIDGYNQTIEAIREHYGAAIRGQS